MDEHAGSYPAELGDGMRKRVAIARALALEPRYVLFDEPTTSLDPVSARRVDQLIGELSDTLGVTSIVVSHDLTSIFSIADRIVMLPFRSTVDDAGRCWRILELLEFSGQDARVFLSDAVVLG